MDLEQLVSTRVLVYFSLTSQTFAVLFILILFLLLRRHAGRRVYFYSWTWAWAALLAGLIALILRYEILLDLPNGRNEHVWWVKLCYLVYQFGKFAFLAWLLQGVLQYVKGQARPPSGYLRLLLPLAAALSVISLLVSPGIFNVLFWQSVVNVPVFIGMGVFMLLLPESRRSLGTRLAAVCLCVTGVLWGVYLIGVLHYAFPSTDFGAGLWRIMTGRNSYLDLIFQMLLAFSMVLILFEDARRELDTAHNELRVAHQQLLRESLIDSLTGAYNRRAFNEGVGLEDARNSFGALVVCDMDNLKVINDHYGHKQGDALLVYFAQVLREGLRPSDKLYRLGGDEFLVMMPRVSAETAEHRMQSLVATAAPLGIDNPAVEIPLSASIGAAAFRDAQELEGSLHQADRAMYVSKRARKTAPRSEMGRDDGELAGE